MVTPSGATVNRSKIAADIYRRSDLFRGRIVLWPSSRRGTLREYAHVMHEFWLQRARDLEIFFHAVPEAFATMLIGAALFKWGVLQGLRRRRIQPSVPRRIWPNRRRKPGRPPETHEASKSRWKVERSHGWLDNWRRLGTRYDWYAQSYVAFLTIACAMTALSRILD